MKHVYKIAAIAIVGITLISAQGVEAQPPKNKQSKNDHFQKGRDQHYDRFDDRRSRGHGNRYGHYKRHNGRSFEQRSFGHGIHYGRVGRLVVHQGQLYRTQQGMFFETRYGRWMPVQAPIGLRVMHLPHGTRVIKTRFGVLYECRGTFYEPARRGLGFIVTNAPRGAQRGHRGSW